MTRLFDDPAEFSGDMIAGFADLYSDRVLAVPGGVVRATAPVAPKVAVIVGGGSGHYPAFCGVVGPGFADGAVVGNVFTSPSTQNVVSVATAANSGRGVLLTYGNYAGDRINFGVAEEQLRAAGLDVRTVLVTDDLASAPLDQIEKRRGIAGDFAVFKIAGAAAEAGYDLASVEAVAQRANSRTRTLGVAFDGCTLPGQSAPLFEVAAGTMDVGLGIHGEPGISQEPLPSASELAVRLVAAVLDEAPADASRVAVILNGLGRTKYEELFVVWRSVAPLLRDRGLAIVQPEVGELVTSLDMEGCSLTLVFLDEELETLWCAPADTPAYRKGSTSESSSLGERRVDAAAHDTSELIEESTAESRSCAQFALAALRAMSQTLHEHEVELGRLDAVAGDGDHGTGMTRGVDAALAAARTAVTRDAGAATTLNSAGAEWAASAGGTSGVLWGSALQAFGAVLGNSASPSAPDLARALTAAASAIQKLGGASVGDKTMLDALLPFVDAFSDAVSTGSDAPSAWSVAAEVATSAAADTSTLRPMVGRARPLAERSIGHPDPGAVSFALAMTAVGTVFNSNGGSI